LGWRPCVSERCRGGRSEGLPESREVIVVLVRIVLVLFAAFAILTAFRRARARERAGEATRWWLKALPGLAAGALVLALAIALLSCSPGRDIAAEPGATVAPTRPIAPPRITVDEVRARQKRGERVIFVDARSAAAWDQATEQIPGSIRVPPDAPEQFMAAVPRDGVVVAYCT
jgi:hypothetical protein